MDDYSLQQRLEVARVVIETQTPLSISEGQGDGLLDNTIVRDGNGLPGIPGSSMAGVIRSVFSNATADAAKVESLFGRAGGEDPFVAASRIQVSWGCIHDQQDRPVEGLLLGKDQERLQQDPVLADAMKAAPIKRDRVRLDHSGCASDQGLFNRTALTAGHRFSFELSLRHDGSKSAMWQQLLAMLLHPEFRLGGGTRAGLGAIQVIRIHQTGFDLSNGADFRRFGDLSPDLGDVSGLTQLELPEAEATLQCQLEVSPCDYFRIGQGFEPLKTESDHEPKLIPVTEQRVLWQKNCGRLGERKLLFPATAIKGALRHRLAYHQRVLAKCFADQNPPDNKEAEANPAVCELFGFAVDDSEDQVSGDNLSNRGRLLLDDLYLEPEPVLHLMHNAIDAYTGGVRNHMLYCEEVVGQKQGTLINWNLSVCDSAEVTQPTRDALQRTLADLIEGRLAIGAGSSRGHGFFTGKMTWSDGGRWIKGEA